MIGGRLTKVLVVHEGVTNYKLGRGYQGGNEAHDVTESGHWISLLT